MKTELEHQLTGLSLEEKSEVVSFLMPFVSPAEDNEGISPELMAELDRRLEAHRADPSGAITLEQFKKREFGNR